VSAMPLVETLPLDAATAQWALWSTTARVVVTDPGAVADARRIVTDLTDRVDLAASRFRTDSELSLLAGHGGRPQRLSPLLAELVATALTAARRTGGAVTPTIGHALADLGYDQDWAVRTPAGVDVRVVTTRAPRWEDVSLDGRVLTMRPGTSLDLGSTAKAWAADRAARLVADELGIGVLVSLGGDIATAGPGPDGGWRVLVRDQPEDPSVTVALPAGAAIATSSTRARRWRSAGREVHHIVDPATCLPAPEVWRTVTVAAADCVTANTLTTAALVLGHTALPWLAAQGQPARLIARDGTVHTVNAWPTSTGSES
jgi:FAD:protein FMN transferase